MFHLYGFQIITICKTSSLEILKHVYCKSEQQISISRDFKSIHLWLVLSKKWFSVTLSSWYFLSSVFLVFLALNKAVLKMSIWSNMTLKANITRNIQFWTWVNEKQLVTVYFMFLQKWHLIDTAGIRKKASVASSGSTTEALSVNRAFRAIRRSDVVALVIEAMACITEQVTRA